MISKEEKEGLSIFKGKSEALDFQGVAQIFLLSGIGIIY
jgi:hypothetical protein